ncbi:hypothetical protein HZS_210 [Henneguya salminicola]|nr:hypothetical protein HZS_210 [Henneguya salminicola]
MKFPICSFIFFYLINVVKCDKIFDRNSKKIDFYAIARIFGYKNTMNRGPFNGCCGNLTEFLCSPCQYVITVRHMTWV